MPENLLKNGGFEADWEDERSHKCLVFPVDGEPFEHNRGECHTPPGWITWYRHDGENWAEPEVRDSWKHHDARRVHAGEKSIMLFTFFRKHDAGFVQQLAVAPGTQLRLTAWAHAWSNHRLEDHEECQDDPRCSCGVGREAGFFLESQAPPLSGDPWSDAISNFTFTIGIDPIGGTDPFADTVVWGQGAHVYNQFHEIPAVEATAQADSVTVFLRSRTAWPFKHNDAYWDSATLVAVGVTPPQVKLAVQTENPQVGQPVTVEARSLATLTNASFAIHQPSGARLAVGTIAVGRDRSWQTWKVTTSPVNEPGTHTATFSADGGAIGATTFAASPAPSHGRGAPRQQYDRTYVLLPPNAGQAWALAAVEGTWDQNRYTIGGSADDAGIGDLDTRKVIAVNPQEWTDDLQAFFETHYPEVAYIGVEAATPQKLRQKLEAM